MTGHSLLVVPLPGLAAALPPLASSVAVPHIPLADPFTDPDTLDDGVLAELRSFFADVVPFEVRFSDLSQFPGGPAYLSPEPSAPFRTLAQGIARLFPEVPRPRGTVDLVPHVTVPTTAELSLEDLRTRLSPWLPASAVVAEAALWRWTDAELRNLATFPFGTSAA